jgi:hypothetical protein
MVEHGPYPEDFVADGCSCAPDKIFGYDISECCVGHDFDYCSRCHPEGHMTKKWRKAADKKLRKRIAAVLPRVLDWIRWIYYRFVRRFGSLSAFDSCGPEAGERCRHNMPMPEWMRTRLI